MDGWMNSACPAELNPPLGGAVSQYGWLRTARTRTRMPLANTQAHTTSSYYSLALTPLSVYLAATWEQRPASVRRSELSPHLWHDLSPALKLEKRSIQLNKLFRLSAWDMRYNKKIIKDSAPVNGFRDCWDCLVYHLFFLLLFACLARPPFSFPTS